MASGNKNRKQRCVWMLALVGVLIGAATAPVDAGKKKKNLLARPVPVDAMPSAPMTLPRANDEWSQAMAQTRIPLPIGKKRNKQGWSKSDWLSAEGERQQMRVWVNDREELRDIIPLDSILVGAHLICERWFLQNPKKGRGVTVEFLFANYPGTLRLEFTGTVEEIDEIERFLRFNVLTVQRRSDRLEAPAMAPAPPSGFPPRSDSVVAAGVRVVSAEARPALVSPGDEIELLITYEIADARTDRHSIIERRTLLREGIEITFFEDTIERAGGEFTSSQKIRIPTTAEPGAYSFLGRIGVGEASDEGSAAFEVR